MTAALRGFADPVHDAQRTFRTLLGAMANPGVAYAVDAPLECPSAWQPALAAAALTLFDRDTPVWYDAAVPLDVRQWIGFHTASPVVAKHAAAHFAILAGPRDGALLSAFDAGTLEFPERSATLLIAVERFDGGLPVELRGPGIADAVRIAPPGLGAPFWEAWWRNTERFPRGLDALLFEAHRVIGLPRTAHAAVVR